VIAAPFSDAVIVQLFLGTEGGGIVTAVNHWAPLLRDAGWDIRFLVLARSGKAVDMLRHAGFDPIAEDFGRFDRMAKLPKRLRSMNATIIHTHNPAAQLWAGRAAKRCGAVVFRTVHADMFEEMKGSLPGWKIALWRRLMSRMIKNAAGIGVVSPHLVSLLPLPKGYDPDRIKIMPNGYDASAITNDTSDLPSEVRAFLGDNEGHTSNDLAPLVLSMGRLVPVKNFAMLLQAFAEVVCEKPESRLILAGSGPLEANLKQLRDELNLTDRILMLPWVDQIAPLVKRADVIAISSFSECCPMLVLEAMAASKPVVATEVGGIPYLIRKNETSLLVPSNDAGALAQALLRLMTDNETARAFGRMNHAELNRRLTPLAAANTMAEVYQSILAR